MTINLSRRTIIRAGLATGAASALGISLTSCSNEGRGGVSGGGSQQATGGLLPSYIPYEGVQPDIPGSDGVADGFLAYPSEPVRAVEEPPGDGAPISALGYTNAPIPPGVARNEFWQALNERIGSEIEISLSTTGDYGQVFPTRVAGGQLPDLFVVGSAPQLPQLLEEEALDLTPYLSGEAIEAYPFLANIPTDSWSATVFNGKIFGVPIPRGVLSTFTLYGRDDLLEEEGIAFEPSDFEDFHSLCTELTHGSSNRWALASMRSDFLRQMFGIPNSWEVVDGQLVSAYEHEEQKDALEAGRRLVGDGLVNPDTFSAQSTTRKTWLANGTCYFLWDTFSAWSDLFNVYGAAASGPFSLATYPLQLADGTGPAAAWLGNPTHNVTAINVDSEERAQTLLAYLDYLAAPFGTEEYLFKRYGVEGTHHTLDGTDPILTEKGRTEPQMGLIYMADPPWPVYEAGEEDLTRNHHENQLEVVPAGYLNPAFGLYSETESRRGGDLSSDMTNLENDIIQGREPVSAWDDAVTQWKQNGGDEIRDELQAALDELS